MATKTSERINNLAKPKPLPAGFEDDRRSVYWEGKLAKDWKKGTHTTTPSLSANQQQLTQPKKLHQAYLGDRPSPIWNVSKGSLSAKSSQRLDSLAEPRRFHKDFQEEKSVYTVVSDKAMKREPSARIEQMAKPKQVKDLSIKPNSAWDWSEWESDIPAAALKAEPKEHLSNLAKPKVLHPKYKEERSVQWRPSNSTLSATASSRLQELASAKSRHIHKSNDSDNEWAVSRAALRAEASERTRELCVPTPWKVRQKRQMAPAN